MIDLEYKTEPFEIKFAEGLSAMVRPLSTLDLSIAQARAENLVNDAAAGVDVFREVGFVDADIEGIDMGDSAQRAGLYRHVLIRELAVRHIISWNGVVNDDGTPAAVTPENCRAAMNNPVVSEAFYQQLTRQQQEILAAKKE